MAKAPLSLCPWRLREPQGRLFPPHSRRVGGEALVPGVSGTGRARPPRGSAWGRGGGSVHWRALQHHLGCLCSPPAPGAELVHFLAFLVALEGDRDRPGLGASPAGPEHPAARALARSHTHPTSSFTGTDPRVHCHSLITHQVHIHIHVHTHAQTHSQPHTPSPVLAVMCTLTPISRTPRWVTHTHARSPRVASVSHVPDTCRRARCSCLCVEADVMSRNFALYLK